MSSHQRIAVVTDSTADLPADVAREYGIHVVPLKVHFGDEEYLDGVTISSEQFYRKLTSSKVLPRSSQPSPHDFQVAYERLLADHDAVMSVHISHETSGTVQSANLAAQQVPGRVVVIDGRFVSLGTGLLAIEAARATKRGASLEEARAVVESVVPRMNLLFTVDTLEYLEKNGRIGKAQALLGTLLNIRPILGIDNGMVTAVDKVRGGPARLLSRIMEIMKDDVKGRTIRVGLVHALVEDTARKWKDAILANFRVDEYIQSVIGPVIGTHSGPGAVGMFYVKES